MAMLNLKAVKGLLTQADVNTLSLYLDVDPSQPDNQTTPTGWRIWLKNTLKQIENDLNKEQRAIWHGLRARAETALQDYRPASKGLALFFGAGFEETYPLPVVVENRAQFGPPLVTPLIWVLDEYKPYLVILIDHEKAHFITAYLGSPAQQETLHFELDTSDWHLKTLRSASNAVAKLTQGNARDEYNQRVDQYLERFYQEAAARAAELARSAGVQRIVIGGNEQAAHAVQRHLAPGTAGQVIGVAPLSLHENAHEMLQHILPLAAAFERQQETVLVAEVINLAKAGGKAALGRENVLAALGQNRAELIIAPWPTDDEVMTQIGLQAIQAGCQIELVRGAAAEHLRAQGGLAARLRYIV
jgi:hypothetical protein